MSRKPSHHITQPCIPGDRQGAGVKPARQNERRAGMSLHPACNDLASGAPPARDQSGNIPALEIDQIDRQQQYAGGMLRPADS
jgi:hypothetical protein